MSKEPFNPALPQGAIQTKTRQRKKSPKGNPELLDQCLKYYTRDKIAEMLGLAKNTIYYWQSRRSTLPKWMEGNLRWLLGLCQSKPQGETLLLEVNTKAGKSRIMTLSGEITLPNGQHYWLVKKD